MKSKLLLLTLFIPLLAYAGETLPGMEFSPDGRYDIGKPTSDRPGNIFVKGSIYSVGNISTGYATTATAAGTTTLLSTSPGTQFFTGSTTQNVLLPVASTMMQLGQSFLIENNSTGAVTVKSSGSNTILVMAAATRAKFTCILLSGTGTSSWDAFYEATNEASGKVVTFDHSSTFTTTDAQTYTFPTTSATLARTDAANTFTGTQTIGALVATTVNGNTITTGSSTFTGTAAQTYTFPSTSATLARTDAANTFTGTQTVGAVSASDDTTYTVAAKGTVYKQGANGRVGTFVANGASAVTVSNSSVAISDAIIISLNTVGGTVGVQPHVATITAGTGFTVVCTASDTSTYNYTLIKNAP